MPITTNKSIIIQAVFVIISGFSLCTIAYINQIIAVPVYQLYENRDTPLAFCSIHILNS